jgi:uncharacterized protein YdeI (YjbR/CyaY-like superfamily)
MADAMGDRTPQVTAYIDRAQPFARPILTKLRALFHRASPHIEEQIKWGAPMFVHKGIVGGMAGFKQHVRWMLWKGKLIDDPRALLQDGGGKPSSVSDLPPDSEILALIRQAVALNESGVKSSSRGGGKSAEGKSRPAPKAPADLSAALKRNVKAAATFKNFSPSHRREYIEWITEAKQPETRNRRLAQTVAWLAEGKPRMWKYMKRK